MSFEKLGELVVKLHKRTDEGKLRWEQTATKGVFLTSLSDFSIEVAKADPEAEAEDAEFAFTIFNKDGDDVESFTDDDLSTLTPAEKDRTYRKLMRDIYAKARRDALGAEEAVDSLLEILDDDEDWEGSESGEAEDAESSDREDKGEK